MDNKYIYIHIGTHKTGTSAIQKFLDLNKKILSKKGLLFPQKSRRDYWEKVNGDYVVSPSKEKYYTQLANICRSKSKHVIVSSETFTLIKDVSVMGRLLKNSRVKIICYLRRQDNLQQSMYNESVKKEYFEEINAYNEYPLDYYLILDKWSKIFGENNIIVRVYEKNQLKNGDLIEDFLDIFNLKLTSEFKLPLENPNPRLCPEALEYKKYLNRIWKNKIKTEIFLRPLLDFSVKKRTDSSSSYYFEQSLLTLEQRTAIIRQYHDSNALIAKKYLGRQNGNLFDETLPKFSCEDVNCSEIINNETMLQITKHLWQNRKTKKALIQTESLILDDNDKLAKNTQKIISLMIQQIKNKR